MSDLNHQEQASYLHDLEGFYPAGIGNVRASTEIDQRSTAIDSGIGAVGHLVIDEVDLVLVPFEHLQELRLRKLQTHERLLVFDGLPSDGLESLPVVWLNVSTVSPSALFKQPLPGCCTCPSGRAMS